MNNKPEVWLRGPLNNMPALLQPVAHALLQAREEVNDLMHDFPEDMLWERPAGLASPAFHLQHFAGVIDRLFTYANNNTQLSSLQLEYLRAEGKQDEGNITVNDLLQRFNKQVDAALIQLQETKVPDLTEPRGVGRAMLPTTVLGLYTHTAEHIMRHTGQLLVTVLMLKAGYLPPSPPAAP